MLDRTQFLQRSLLAIVALVLALGTVNAQKALIREADRRYDALSFAEAAHLYEAASTKGASDADVAPRLADSYWRLRDMANAEKWYARAVALPEARSQYVYRYSEALRSNGKAQLADQQMERYRSMASGDSRVERQRNASEYVKSLSSENLFGATVKHLDVNSDRCDMGTSFLGERIVFASSRLAHAAEERNHTWNNAPFLDLYEGTAEAGGGLTHVHRLEGPFNTRFHDSNLAAAADGKEVWYTRNNFDDRKRGHDQAGVTRLKIYGSKRTAEGTWGPEVAFAYNGDAFSTGHPALTPTGDRLYFTSDRPGGRGGTDIWYCDRNFDGSWAAPVNAGAVVNTEGNEMFPSTWGNDRLFFASDGQQGLGGLDMQMAKVSGASFTALRNLGAPLNSGADDFALLLRPDGRAGYFTSNRAGGTGDDDLYSFSLGRPLGTSQAIEGLAIDASTGLPIANAVITIVGPGDERRSTNTDAEGHYRYDAAHGANYDLVGAAEGFASATAAVPALLDVDTVVKRDLRLAPVGQVVLWYTTKHALTGAPLGEVKIDRLDVLGMDKMEKAAVFVTAPSGEHREILKDIQIGDSIVYYLELTKPGFYPKKGYFRYKVTEFGEVDVHRYMDMCLFPMEPMDMQLACVDGLDRSGFPVTIGRDLGTMIDINPIYFDLNKDVIRPDAALELDKIVAVMKKYPAMVIELGSHTDCRASKSYNMALSDRRAKSSAAYIVSKGVDASRITGKGFGESKLVNGCACEGAVKSKCSEQEHQRNRRTEFIIVKM